jgi:uncharacterized membrane protein
MGKLSRMGRVCYGLAVIETGLQTIYYHDFPYWLVPPKHAWIPGISIIAYISGALVAAAGLAIVFNRKAREAGLLLGSLLVLVFCLAHVSYQLIVGTDVFSLVQWENAEKELAFACGGFVIAGSISAYRVRPGLKFLEEFIPFGSIVFALMIMCFGTIHCLYAKEASGYVPSWVPGPVIWMYITGIALLGSGVSIIFKIQTRIIAFLLGAMVFTWFVILHIPRIIVSPVPYLGSEITSAMLALAYSGIAFVIAGTANAR